MIRSANVTIPAKERDPGLVEKLRAEWPGILSWAVYGCRDWQKQGLAPPAAVVAATAHYLEEEDSFGAWLSDCCKEDRGAWTAGRDLFASYIGWTTRMNEFAVTNKRFSQTLEARGFKSQKSGGQRGFKGLTLLTR
jgi:putative DNA primase/helicase